MNAQQSKRKPKCRMRDCFSNKNGVCFCLVDNDFGKPCPFYKLKGEGLETWEE